MENRKAIEILKTFSPKEFKQFWEFISLSFFNKDEKVILMLEVLNNHYPSFDKKDLSEEKLYHELFPKEKYNDKKFRYLMTDMTKLLEQYLVHQKFSSETILQKYWMMENLEERGLDKHFQSTMEYARHLHKKQPHRDTDYFYHWYLLESVYNNFLSKRKKPLSRKQFAGVGGKPGLVLHSSQAEILL